jgi:holo-[acyl-carrier protein] synthase
MKSYVGTDIIEIAHIRQALERHGERFLNRVYTPAERGLYAGKAPSLAARFAGKEAVMKLLGAKGIGWQDIEILARPGGQPLLNLYGKAQSKAQELGIKDIAISLSHSRDYAVATAIGTS